MRPEDIFKTEDKLKPDDPRVNHELHMLVSHALTHVAREGFANLDPVSNPNWLHDLKARSKTVRLRVIEEYEKAKAKA